MMRRALVWVLALAPAVVLAVAVAAPADAVRVENPTRWVEVPAVSYLEPVGAGRVFVELDNGAAYRLAPCRYEDGAGCWWDASTAGNGRGWSFVAVRVGRRVCVLYIAHPGRNYCQPAAQR